MIINTPTSVLSLCWVDDSIIISMRVVDQLLGYIGGVKKLWQRDLAEFAGDI